MSPESLQLKKEFEIQKIALNIKAISFLKVNIMTTGNYFMSKMEALKLHFLIKSFLQ